MIGGGLGSYIGKFHRWGAMLDDSAELVCGCFSRSMDKNRATAEAYHLPDTSRVYADFREMADKESTREDGIDFVSIMTANDTHYEIAKCFLEHDIHVICDKPLALRTEEAEELARPDTKHALGRIELHIIPSQSCESFLEVRNVIGARKSLDQHVVDVNLHVSPDLLLEHLVDQPLVSRACILQTKGHPGKIVQAQVGDERGGVLV